jgi:hypothetical protein
MFLFFGDMLTDLNPVWASGVEQGVKISANGFLGGFGQKKVHIDYYENNFHLNSCFFFFFFEDQVVMKNWMKRYDPKNCFTAWKSKSSPLRPP